MFFVLKAYNHKRSAGIALFRIIGHPEIELVEFSNRHELWNAKIFMRLREEE